MKNDKDLSLDLKADLHKIQEYIKNHRVTGYFVVCTVSTPTSDTNAYYCHVANNYINLISVVDIFNLGLKQSAFNLTQQQSAHESDQIDHEDAKDSQYEQGRPVLGLKKDKKKQVH